MLVFDSVTVVLTLLRLLVPFSFSRRLVGPSPCAHYGVSCGVASGVAGGPECLRCMWFPTRGKYSF